jgi:hypothetical protein
MSQISILAGRDWGLEGLQISSRIRAVEEFLISVKPQHEMRQLVRSTMLALFDINRKFDPACMKVFRCMNGKFSKVLSEIQRPISMHVSCNTFTLSSDPVLLYVREFLSTPLEYVQKRLL